MLQRWFVGLALVAAVVLAIPSPTLAGDVFLKIGLTVHPDVNLIVIPASRKVYQRAMDEGILQEFIKAGANIESSNCGPCFGSHMGVLAGQSKMISSSNRNYQGRMGSPNAQIFLGSPATVVASAIEGRLADPRKYL